MIINNYIKFTSFFHSLARHRLGTIKNIPYKVTSQTMEGLVHMPNPFFKIKWN